MDNDGKSSDILVLDGGATYPLAPELITPDAYIESYMQYVKLYIAHRKPSDDTIRTYSQNIKQFLEWCEKHGRNPLSFSSYQVGVYFSWLNSTTIKKTRLIRDEQGNVTKKETIDVPYSNATLNLKYAAVKTFYATARKMGLIKNNPCDDLDGGKYLPPDDKYIYLNNEQIAEVFRYLNKDPREFIRYRNLSIAYLMGIEGLMGVEIHRMNFEDIDWTLGEIKVRGRGRGRISYPCDDTLKAMKLYADACPSKDEIKRDDGSTLTPFVLGFSGRNMYGRITRKGLQEVIDDALRALNYKVRGHSCQLFRDSCGANLYDATKDLKLVQKVLGHSDPKVTARYARRENREKLRRTSQIAPKLDDL